MNLCNVLACFDFGIDFVLCVIIHDVNNIILISNRTRLMILPGLLGW